MTNLDLLTDNLERRLDSRFAVDEGYELNYVDPDAGTLSIRWDDANYDSYFTFTFNPETHEVLTLEFSHYSDDDDVLDDPMDGDHESALASAGYGTDEDYGYYGGDDW